MDNQIPYMYNPQMMPNNFNNRPNSGNLNREIRELDRKIESLGRRIARLEKRVANITFRENDQVVENDYSIYPPATDNYML